MPTEPNKYWRADGGLKDVPPPPPAPAPPPAYNMAMYAPAQYYPPPGTGCACHPQQSFDQPYPQYQHQWLCQPNAGGGGGGVQYVNGPLGIGGLCTTPPPAYEKLSPPPPPAPEEKKPDEKKDEKKDDKKTKEKRVNVYAPPKLPSGAGYMFDKGEHMMLHIFNKAAPVWEEKYRTQDLKFKMFKVSLNFTVKMIIENIRNKGGDECKEWAATEVVEAGGGGWTKGTTIKYDDGKSDGKLKSMGWTVKRGDALPPVWLVVHKVDFKK